MCQHILFLLLRRPSRWINVVHCILPLKPVPRWLQQFFLEGLRRSSGHRATKNPLLMLPSEIALQAWYPSTTIFTLKVRQAFKAGKLQPLNITGQKNDTSSRFDLFCFRCQDMQRLEAVTDRGETPLARAAARGHGAVVRAPSVH